LSPRLLQQFLSFALIGLLGTAAHFLVLYVLVSQLDFGPVSASSVGAVTGALVNYGLNYRLTFRSQKKHRDALPKFLVVASGGLVAEWPAHGYPVVPTRHSLSAGASHRYQSGSGLELPRQPLLDVQRTRWLARPEPLFLAVIAE
jgi:hypothetical protein